MALAGCDLLTISPELLSQLSASEVAVPRLLSPELARLSPTPDVRLDEAAFRYALNEDAMATEKLAEGIRLFTKDLRTLREMVSKRLEQAE